MKINEITLFEYGKFDNKKVIKLSENRPNLIYGKNETGKTTIVSAVIELIFGFERSKKDKHRYLPRNGERLNIAMSYLNNLGKMLTVKRLLSNNVKSIIEDGLEVININNKSLPEAENISRNIYSNVYRITSEQLKEIETKPFSELQDKLVLNYGNSNVSPKTVIQQLDEDVKSLYNARSLGNKQAINKLNNEIKELKKEKKEKINLYNEVRVMSEDIQKVDRELIEIDQKIIEKVKFKNQINHYLKPIELINKIENLKANVENYDQYERLDRDILGQFESIEKTVVSYREDLNVKEGKMTSKEDKVEVLSYDEKIALNYKNEVDDIEKLSQQVDKVRDDIEKIDEYSEMNAKKLINESGYLFKKNINKVVGFDLKMIQTLF